MSLAAGTYYIGCPSRVTEYNTLKGGKKGKTATPIGNFLGSDGTKFHVESGCIVMIPYENLSVYEKDASDFGMVLQFDEPIKFISRRGKFSIVSGEYALDIDTTIENEDDDFTFESYDDMYEYAYEEEECEMDDE